MLHASLKASLFQDTLDAFPCPLVRINAVIVRGLPGDHFTQALTLLRTETLCAGTFLGG